MDKRPMDGVRIGILGKGGSGKTTVTVFLALALQEAGYSVVVVDADSTNHGLATALGVDREPDPLLDFFGGMVFSGGLVTCPVDDPTPLAGARLQPDRLPGRFVGRNPEGVRLLVAGKLGALGPGAGCDGPVAKIARDLRVEELGPHPVTLVDFKAGFEDAARGVLTTVDCALVVVDPTTAAVQIARHLTEVYLREALEGSGAPVLAVFPEEPVVAEQWLRGERLQAPRAAEAARTLVSALERVAPDQDAPAPPVGADV